MITRYDFMQTVKQPDGKEYPDVLSFSFDHMVLHEPTEQVLIREHEYLRPDLFFFKKQGTNNMEDIQLWVNEVPSRRDMQPGLIIQLIAQSDLNSFYIRNRV